MEKYSSKAAQRDSDNGNLRKQTELYAGDNLHLPTADTVYVQYYKNWLLSSASQAELLRSKDFKDRTRMCAKLHNWFTGKVTAWAEEAKTAKKKLAKQSTAKVALSTVLHHFYFFINPIPTDAK